jgi:DNA-directed RNA polymerase subunit RPC12/RpoP
MDHLSFSCAFCGRSIAIGREFSGARVECPDCRRLTPVPGPRLGTLRGLNPDVVLPPQILGIEIKFLCEHCGTKLMIDFRWQGRTVDCPSCQRILQVPRCSDPECEPEATAITASSTPAARLSPAELAFLSEATLPGSS